MYALLGYALSKTILDVIFIDKVTVHSIFNIYSFILNLNF